MRRHLLWTMGCLALLGGSLSACTGYAAFIATLNDRKVTSCIEGTVNVGVPISTGMLHVYTATGGATVSECIQFFRHLPVTK